MMKSKSLVRVFAAMLAVVSLGGCAKVKAYERGRLLQPTMQAPAALDTAFDTHVHELRESVFGATDGDSASCGCR